MRVSNKVWLLAAISVPLTLFTILLWWGWVHFTKVEQTMDPEQPGIVTLQRAHSFRSVISAKKKKKDLESGLAFSPQRLRSSTFRHATNTPTWSSDATTVTVKAQ
jgi:low temperature requirement protein LtrA